MLESLGSEAHLQASRVLDLEGAILASLNNVRQEKITALKSRIHGDYHLGQVLYTGKDFIIIDFEGEPARPLSERRLKRSCLRDVAGMIRSFHYVVNSELTRHGIIRPEDVARLEPWTDLWYHCVSATFTHAYLSELADSALIPVSKEHRGILLQTFLLQKSLYELQYELNNRPDWVIIPLKGIIHTVEGHGNAKEHNANT
jgi:maltose alpha-D-glucosyltransferase/alpha-amylase